MSAIPFTVPCSVQSLLLFLNTFTHGFEAGNPFFGFLFQSGFSALEEEAALPRWQVIGDCSSRGLGALLELGGTNEDHYFGTSRARARVALALF